MKDIPNGSSGEKRNGGASMVNLPISSEKRLAAVAQHRCRRTLEADERKDDMICGGRLPEASIDSFSRKRVELTHISRNFRKKLQNLEVSNICHPIPL